MKPITKRNILDNRFAFAENEEILINALDACELIIEHEHMARQIVRLMNDIDILKTRLALRECETYRKIDLRA